MRSLRHGDVQNPPQEIARLRPEARLTIDHPKYRYPPSRNPYWRKLQEFPAPGLIYCDNQTEQNPGQWLGRFGISPSELQVEIGCNAGHVVLAWAAKNPQQAYVGLDWKFKMIHKGAEKASRLRLKNLIFLRAHAERLSYIFGKGEVDAFHVFFPDPWPKKSQWKNRYLTSARFRALHSLLKPGGLLWIKTDHAGYFEWIESALHETAELWKVEERTRDLHANCPEPLKLEIPEVTLFEKLFIRDGIAIKSLKLRAK